MSWKYENGLIAFFMPTARTIVKAATVTPSQPYMWLSALKSRASSASHVPATSKSHVKVDLYSHTNLRSFSEYDMVLRKYHCHLGTTIRRITKHLEMTTSALNSVLGLDHLIEIL